MKIRPFTPEPATRSPRVRTIISVASIVTHMARTITKIVIAIALAAILYKLATGRSSGTVDVDVDTME
jgi:hypothetical protein